MNSGQGKTAIIAGGSIGGLFAAVALLRAGWNVRIHERIGEELAGRGAGIVTHPELLDAFELLDVNTKDLGVMVDERVAFDQSGNVARRLSFPQLVTSWDRIHSLLRSLIPDGAYQLGSSLKGFRDDGTVVTVEFEDGSHETADLLIGADGFRSAIRRELSPEVVSEFSGYIVWRAIASEAELSEEFRREVFPYFGVYAPNGMQVIGYPIAGPNNDLRPGHRRYNLVWYVKVDDEERRDMLTDATGRFYEISIPPPLVRDEVIGALHGMAGARLPAHFAEMLRIAERPFFSPIYDHCSPAFAKGRVALCGDAASSVRPHAGMGVTKAAQDALALARHLGTGTIEHALEGYSRERAEASHRAFIAARALGSYIFDCDPEGNKDGASNPKLDVILRQTAAMVS